MKLDELGLNHSLSDFARCHTVTPLSSAVSSDHFKIATPKSSSIIPSFFSYQTASAYGSLYALRTTPLIPVTFAMRRRYHAGVVEWCYGASLGAGAGGSAGGGSGFASGVEGSGFVTGAVSGFVTGDESGLVTGDESGLVTGDPEVSGFVDVD